MECSFMALGLAEERLYSNVELYVQTDHSNNHTNENYCLQVCDAAYPDVISLGRTFCLHVLAWRVRQQVSQII
jgi:hypothetical protein